MGQTRNVMVYRLLCSDSVDARIMRIIEQKQLIFDAFADKSEAAQIIQGVDVEAFKQIVEDEIVRMQKKGYSLDDSPKKLSLSH